MTWIPRGASVDYDGSSKAHRDAWRAMVAHEVAQFRAFLENEDITPEQVTEAMIRARAKLHQPREHRMILVAPNDAPPSVRLPTLDEFLSRYAEGEIVAALHEWVAERRAVDASTALR
jgi:hypothetical protein